MPKQQMPTPLYYLLFLASAPVVLMPGTLALVTKSHRVVPISCFNILVCAVTYLNLKSVTYVGSILLLIAWLVLLRFAILPKDATGE